MNTLSPPMAARLVAAGVTATGHDTLTGATVSGTVTAVFPGQPRAALKRQKADAPTVTLLVDGAATSARLVDATFEQPADRTLGDEAGDIGHGWPAGVLVDGVWHAAVGDHGPRYNQFIAATFPFSPTAAARLDAATEYVKWATADGYRPRSIFGAAVAAGAGGHLAIEAARPTLPPLGHGCLVTGGPTMAAMRLIVGEGRCIVQPLVFDNAVADLVTEIPIKMRGNVEAWLRGGRTGGTPPHTADADWWIFEGDAATAAAWPFLLHPAGRIGPTQWRALMRHAPATPTGSTASVSAALGDVGANKALRVLTVAALRTGVSPTAATGVAAQLTASIWMESQGWTTGGGTNDVDRIAEEVARVGDAPAIDGDAVYYHLRNSQGERAADRFTACFWSIKAAGAIEGVPLSAPAFGDYRDGKLVEAWVDLLAHLVDVPIPDIARLARYGRGGGRPPATSAVIVFLASDMTMRGARAVALPGTADCAQKLGYSKATGGMADMAGFFFVIADRHVDLKVAPGPTGGYAFAFGADDPTVVFVEDAHSSLIYAP